MGAYGPIRPPANCIGYKLPATGGGWQKRVVFTLNGTGGDPCGGRDPDRKGNFYGWTEFGDAKFGNPAFKIMP